MKTANPPSAAPMHHENLAKALRDTTKAIAALREANRYGNPYDLYLAESGQLIDAALDRCIGLCEEVKTALSEGLSRNLGRDEE